MNCSQNGFGEQCVTAAQIRTTLNPPHRCGGQYCRMLSDCDQTGPKQNARKEASAFGHRRLSASPSEFTSGGVAIEFEFAVGHCGTARREFVAPVQMEIYLRTFRCQTELRLGCPIFGSRPSSAAARSAARTASRTSDRTSESPSPSDSSPLVPTCLAPRGVRLFPAPALQVPAREAPHEPPHEPQPHIRIAVAARLAPLVPTCLAPSRRASLSGSRPSSAASRDARTNRRTNLSPHIRIAVAAATRAARPDVSRAPRGGRLLPAPALQAPRREPRREPPHEPQVAVCTRSSSRLLQESSKEMGHVFCVTLPHSVKALLPRQLL